MPVFIGTSGWQYRHWRDRFYRGVPQKLWLEHYATRFETVESNNAFYRLPERSTFEAWAERTPSEGGTLPGRPARRPSAALANRGLGLHPLP